MKKLVSLLTAFAMAASMTFTVAQAAEEDYSRIGFGESQFGDLKSYYSKGATADLSILALDADGEETFFEDYDALVYSSSNENVVTVDANGKMTMRDYGVATVSAKYGNLSTSMLITVTPKSIASTKEKADVSLKRTGSTGIQLYVEKLSNAKNDSMESAKIEKKFTIKNFEDVELGILHWPLSVIRLRSKNRESIVNFSEYILGKWRGYTDEDAYIFSETDGEKHNTITPIARMKDGCYEIDLTLRNNITTEECPLGLYHPHNERHHIKKENIGLIEVMGLAILPARLDTEMKLLAECLVGKKNLDDFEELSKHKDWVLMLNVKYPEINEENVMDILECEIGKVFIGVLEDAGVYKCTPEGREAFERFIKTL